jgi:1-acyl-sn-glycerol-3-phosphate acyltransferase
MKKFITFLSILMITLNSFSQGKKVQPYLKIPIIDLDKETFRQVVVDREDGQYLSHPKPLPNELTGDRHVLKYTPDGRLLAVFRDISPLNTRPELAKLAKERDEVNLSKIAAETSQGSPTEGDWIGWVGTWKDLMKGKKGEFRIRFKDNIHSWDCCYPGVELLPDGTFVVTTYGHWEKDKEPYIVSVRFKMQELDDKLRESK